MCRKEQNNPNIAWDSIKFDKTLIDMEPEQGIPRYVTVEREAHTDFMVRRGLALMVNHGFASTPGGQKDFMYKVATIAGAVQETCDQSGVMALLRCKNMYSGHATEMVRDAHSAYDMFQHELWKWGIIQHSQRGWYHMDAEAESILQTGNVEPDTWIVPSRMRSYAAMGQHAETEVYRAGEKTARGNLELGKKNFSTFRGKKVYEVRPYQLDIDGRVVDPLNRTRMIGDFFIVPYFAMNEENKLECGAGETQVYCCETDRFEKFGWQQLSGDIEFSAYDKGSKDSGGDDSEGLGGDGSEGSGGDGSKHSGGDDLKDLYKWHTSTAYNGGNNSKLDVETSKLLDPPTTDPLLVALSEAMPSMEDGIKALAARLEIAEGNAATITDLKGKMEALTLTVERLAGLNKAMVEQITNGDQTQAAAAVTLEALKNSLLGMVTALQGRVEGITTGDITTRAMIAKLTDSLKDLQEKMQTISVPELVVEQEEEVVEQVVLQGEPQVGPDGQQSTEVLESKFTTRTRAALEHALQRAIRVNYQVDPSCAQAAQGTWAIVRSSDPERAATKSRDLYMAALEEMILGLSAETVGELNDAIHFDEHGNQYSIEQVANDLYDAYLDPVASNAGFEALKRKASAAGTNAAEVAAAKFQERANATKEHMLYKAETVATAAHVMYGPRDGPRDFWKKSENFSDDMVRFIRMYYSIPGNTGDTPYFKLDQFENVIDAFSRIAVRLFSPAHAHGVSDGLQSLWYILLGGNKEQFCPLYVILWVCNVDALYDHVSRASAGEDTWAKCFDGSVVPVAPDEIVKSFNRLVEIFHPYNVQSLLSSVYHVLYPFLTEGKKHFMVVETGDHRTLMEHFDWSDRRWNDPRGASKDAKSDRIYDILCLRPFREYTMGTGMLMKKGSELGNTFRGWADFQLTDNIIAKTHIGHFTFWHASIVTNPKCLFLAEDIFCTNYIRGEGKKVLKYERRAAFNENPMGVMQEQEADIICVPIPLGSMDPSSHRLSMNNPVSLNNTLAEHSAKFSNSTRNMKIDMVSLEYPSYIENVQVVGRSQADVNKLIEAFKTICSRDDSLRQYSCTKLNDRIMDAWGFKTLNNPVDIESANTFETSGNLINTICFHTMQKFRNAKNNRWEVTNLNTGHFGENGIYEGVKKIRCGFIDYFKEMDYQKSMAMGGMCI